MRVHRRSVSGVAALAAALSLAGAAPATAKPPLHPVIILVSQQSPLARASRLRHGETRLRAAAAADQASLRDLLRRHAARGQAADVRPLWIVNQIAVRASDDVVRELARRPDVIAVIPDAPVAITLEASPAAMTAVTPANLQTIGAPQLWADGVRGSGVVVASLDTGVDLTDPDLAAAYRGGAASWFDPYGEEPAPVDRNGHGTWTMGVIAGGADTGTSVGVAPEARWIAARVFDDSGRATISGIHAAFQWALDPDGNPATNDAPQVVDAPWALDAPGCDTTFQPDIAALRAIDVLTVFAAGNAGPLDHSDRSPANNAGAVSVGATDATDGIASFSSRGPSSCTGATFPTMTAPGVAIPTTDRFGLGTTELGTSMAAPHVAGALALLLGAFPGLTADQQEAALVAGAVDLGPAGADSVYGAGRLDVLAAHEQLAGSSANQVIFSDGFESGTLAAWAGRHGHGLRVSRNAALSGRFGLDVRGSRGSSAVVDRRVSGQTRVHITVRMAATSLDTAGRWDDAIVGFGPHGQRLFALQLRSARGVNELRLQTRTGPATAVSPGAPLRPGRHDVGLVWSPRDSGADLALDGVPAGHVSRAARRALGRVELGWLFRGAESSGSLAFDDYRSTG